MRDAVWLVIQMGIHGLGFPIDFLEGVWTHILLLGETFFSDTIELRSKGSGGHQYFHTKNTFGCLQQVYVAPPLLGHLFVLLLLVFYFEYHCLQRAHSVYNEGLWAETLLSCHQSLYSFLSPVLSCCRGVGLLHIESWGPHLTNHHSSEKLRFLSPSVYRTPFT